MAPVTVERLKTRRDFLRVAGQRRKWVTPGLILQAAPTPGAPLGQTSNDRTASARRATTDMAANALTEPTPPLGARVGFTVSKKVGNAVARNRARRRLKAAAADLMPDLATPGTDYVIIGRGMTLDRDWSDLLRDLRTALTRVLDAPVDGGPAGGRKGGPDKAKRRRGKGPRTSQAQPAERTGGQ